jgi:anti-anti-sigma factor
MTSVGQLTCRVTATDDEPTVVLQGQLYDATAALFQEAVKAAGAAPRLHVDLSELDFMDCTGARAITDVVGFLSSLGTVVTVTDVNGRHRSAFERIGMGHFLHDDGYELWDEEHDPYAIRSVN